MKDRFILPRTVAMIINGMDECDQLRMWEAIIRYGLDDQKPDAFGWSGMDCAIFAMCAGEIDKYNGKKGKA